MSSTRIHIHLDVIGGMAGDMFSAAMLDAFPALHTPLENLLSNLKLSSNAGIRLETAMDKGLSGRRFQVCIDGRTIADKTHLILTSAKPSNVLSSSAHAHHHYRWQEVIQRLEQANLPEDIAHCARGIYSLLAQAECAIHNTTLEQLHLHEVGTIDALIDIISAAFLILRSQATSWSVSELPWGGGVTHCAHGSIPLPAPATLKLLDGFTWFDDGQEGERITPTGAAILAWLKPFFSPIQGDSGNIGYGFGHRQFKKCANVLRASSFYQNESLLMREQVISVQCDIDDMTPELLAIAVDLLRQREDVIDLNTYSGQGKKQRWVTHLDIICRPEHLDEVCKAIFLQTSTLGVRFHPLSRYVLPRRNGLSEGQGAVKFARRPDGEESCKLEADYLQQYANSHHQRQRLKASAEYQLISGEE